MLKPLDAIATPNNRVLVYLMGGVRTAPEFMKPLYDELTRRFNEEAGWESYGGLLLPYGDWSRRLAPQVREVWRDIRLPMLYSARSIGGRIVDEKVLENWRGEAVLLVGHSGGGVAAVHAAKRLHEQHSSIRCIVIQIGSPKCPVPPPLQPFTAWCYASKLDGSVRDLICRLGTWKSSIFDGWPPRRQRPGSLIPLPISGGHPDYFRTRLMDDHGRSNLDITMEAVWGVIRKCWFGRE
jgi:pimeloyl-ACP methyl ester carboxylesterase